MICLLYTSITVFINCKIRDREGKLLGIVGVGFRVNYIQKIFGDYEEQYQIKAYLVDKDGNIQISTSQTGYDKTDLFSFSGYSQLKDQTVSYTHLYPAAMMGLFLLCVVYLVRGGYNPFIYFNF